MDLNKLVRNHLKMCGAYTPGEQPTDEGWVKLNTNENPFPPLPEVIEDMKNALNDRLKKYPDPTAFEVRKMILSVLLRDEGTLTNRNTVFIGNAITSERFRKGPALTFRYYANKLNMRISKNAPSYIPIEIT